MNIEDFKKRRWILFGAPATPLLADMFAHAPAQEFIPIFGLPCEVMCLSKGNYLEWLYDEAQVIAFSEHVLPRLLSDPWGMYAKCREVAEEYSDLHDSVMKKDFSLLTDEELQVVFREYVDVFRMQFAWNNVIEPLGFYLQDRFRGMLMAEGVTGEDADILMDAYGRSKYPNYVKDCLAEYEVAKSDTEVQIVLERYSYLTNDYLGPKPLTVEYMENLRKQEVHEPESHTHISISPQAEKLLEVFQFAATIQDVRKRESLMMVSGTDKLVGERARRTGIPHDALLYTLCDELMSKSVQEPLLRERMKQSVYFWGKNGTETLSGEEGDWMSDAIRNILYEKTGSDEIKGVCVSRGKAKGRVVVVMQPDEFHKVQAGDILFTMMTRPEFLPVMQLAAAFVTDEGGITSHAAIVAREMKKPCIVATKTGTKTVKDGDLVEVDADNGVVRIIERV